MVSVLNAVRSASIACIAAIAASSMPLAAHAQAKGESGPAGALELEALPAQQLEKGRCGLFLWAREAQARQRLSDLGFHNVSAPSQLTDDPNAVNTVTGQSPSPGTTRKLSDRITIFIGKLAEVSSPTPSVTESSGSPTP